MPHHTSMLLEELAIKYSCDKYYSHSYIDTGFYEQLFSPRKVRRLLEIGIGYEELMKPLVPKYIHGASLYMWEEYFDKAEIFSCDIRPGTLINKGRIHSVVCDQYDLRSMNAVAHSFGGNFDVIIDDGCHHTLAQVVSFMALWPHLTTGGIYIIEDVGYPDVVSKAIDGEIHIFRKDGRWDDVAVTREK